MTPNLISIIWPYWQRGEAMLRGAENMLRHYGGRSDVEIVVVDDGSPHDTAREALNRIPTTIGGKFSILPVRLVELPIKRGPLNPCVPINRGVAASQGEFIVLTNPENTHRAPILDAMREECKEPDDYVLAACFCPETQAWHCHSIHANAGYHFCAMLRRTLWDKAGGFDEEYRDGYCFDDPDWVQRALRAGANFKFRDDLVVDHHLEGAKHYRPREDWERNHELFFRKWPVTRSVFDRRIEGPMDEDRLNNRTPQRPTK